MQEPHAAEIVPSVSGELPPKVQREAIRGRGHRIRVGEFREEAYPWEAGQGYSAALQHAGRRLPSHIKARALILG